jgi:hypothetical protein
VVVLLSTRAQTGRKALKVVAPGEPVLLLPAGVVPTNAHLPKFFLLIGIHVTLPWAALDHAGELGIYGICYVH